MRREPELKKKQLKGELNAASFQYLPHSTAIVLLLTTIILLGFPGARHIAIVPVSVCGFFTGAELIRVMWQRLDILSPRSVMAAFSFYFFYGVPVFHMVLDDWPRYVPPPESWRGSLANLATLQAFGLLLYLFFVTLKSAPPASRYLNVKSFKKFSTIGIVVGTSSWLFVAATFGGPVAYLTALVEGRAELTGYGFVLIFAESWPSLILACILVVKRNTLSEHTFLLILTFVSFLILQFLVGGLRGSRALTVWPFFICLVICHLVVRRISGKILGLSALLLFGFAWIYSIYKNAGSDILTLFSGEQTATDLANETGRSVGLMLTGDFGRTGVQLLALDKVLSGIGKYWGETYLGDILIFIPDALHVTELRNKTDATTEVLYGQPVDQLGGFESSRILGLTGEALVNFGLAGALVSFILLARIVSRFEAVFQHIKANPTALGTSLIAATLPAMSILVLISDLDNLILFSLKYALPIILIAWLASKPKALSSGRRREVSSPSLQDS